jgi:hypothetical protein
MDPGPDPDMNAGPDPDMAVEDPGCDEDRDCAGNEFCADGNECISGCRRDPDNCGAGRRCNAVRQCANGCADTPQCVAENGAGWVCERSQCIGPCDDHGDCDPGELCNGEHCEDGCGDDDFEANDGRADATRLQIGGNGYDSLGTYVSICEFDSDWFIFTQPVDGSTLTVRVGFEHDAGDLDIRLHPPGNAASINGSSANDNERIEVEDAADGSWHLQVFGRGFDENRYRIEIDVEVPDGACIGDGADPGDDEAENALVLDLPQLQSRQVVRNRRICPGDQDWFAFDMRDGDGVDISVAMSNFDGGFFDGLDFEVYGPGVPGPGDFPAMLPDGFEEGPPVTISFTAPRNNLLVVEGRYFLKVLAFDPGLEGQFDLTVEVDRVALACVGDPVEPNDNRGAAENLMNRAGFVRDALDGVSEIRAGVDLRLGGLTVCEGDEDWFRFELRPGDDIDVRIQRSEPVRGVMLVEIMDANGNRVGQFGQSAQAVNAARLEGAAAGVYYGRISAPDEDTTTAYALQLNRTAGQIPCPADGFEGNDAREDAAELNAGNHNGLTLCGAEGDVDYFVVELDAVSDLAIDVDFIHDDANLDVDVYRDDNDVAENANQQQGHSNGNGEAIFLGNRLPGLYTIAVRSLDGGTTGYDVSIGVTERVFVCDDDDDEANDVLGDATQLGGGELVRDSQWLCDRVPSESDWFEIQVPPGTARTLVTTFVFGDDGDLFLELYDANGDLEATTNNVARVNSKQCLRIRTGDGNDTFFLRVAPLNINRIIDDDERLDYTLHIADGDLCDEIGPPAPGVSWPRVRR